MVEFESIVASKKCGMEIVDKNITLPKRRFWKAEQKMKYGFSIEFSTIRSPNRVLTTLKSASFEIRIYLFVHPSNIFVWDGVTLR